MDAYLQFAEPACHKTRLAPTPSGFLHLGNALSFILTATLAHKQGALTLLRIDDMDRQRVRPEYVQDIFDTLHFLGLPWQEGPRDYNDFELHFSQLQRMPLYREALQFLRTQGHLFACNCSRTDLAGAGGIYHGACLHKHLSLDEPGVCWRLRTDKHLPLKMHTWHGIVNATLPEEQQYFIVRKKDGDPAYQLTSLIDDSHFGVDLVIRGADLWPSTLAQLYLAQLLGLEHFSKTEFYHHTLLAAPSGLKLSKSAGDTSIRYLRLHGKTAPDICRLIAGETGLTQTVGDWQELGALLLAQLPEFLPE